MSAEGVDEVWGDRRDAVNMTAKELDGWLGTESQSVGQKRDGDVEETPWRCSLMNWGHDPLEG